MRYEAVLGPGTKQWWLYDTETDEYCDPPIKILNVLKLMSNETAEDLDAQAYKLELIANSDNDWIDDKEHRYPADEYDI